jgi:hypothetical protein
LIKNQNNDSKKVDKVLINIIKQQAKEQDFKVVSNCIYKVIGKYFIYAVFWTQNAGGKWNFFLRMNIKLYSYDDLFWEIFEMPENKSTKDSLRANGAYVCPPFQWMEKSYELSKQESFLIEITDSIVDFQSEINKFILLINKDYQDFNSFILQQSNILDEQLLKMIACISKQDYKQAYELAENQIKSGNWGGYSNKGKDIYEYILKYCNTNILDVM